MPAFSIWPLPEPPKSREFGDTSFADPGLQAKPSTPPAPDLHSQLEDLWNQVWDSERRENILDRCDNAARIDAAKDAARRRKAQRDPSGSSSPPQG